MKTRQHTVPRDSLSLLERVRRSFVFRTLFLIVLTPILILVLVMFYIVVIAPYAVFHLVRFRSRLARSHRLTSPRKLIAAGQPGTLIVNRPGMEGNTTECWWTSDRVLSITPHPIPTKEERWGQLGNHDGFRNYVAPPFDRWCWENYLNPESGRALLVAFYGGQRTAIRLRQRMPIVEVVRAESCTVDLEILGREVREEDAIDDEAVSFEAEESR